MFEQLSSCSYYNSVQVDFLFTSQAIVRPHFKWIVFSWDLFVIKSFEERLFRIVLKIVSPVKRMWTFDFLNGDLNVCLRVHVTENRLSITIIVFACVTLKR